MAFLTSSSIQRYLQNIIANNSSISQVGLNGDSYASALSENEKVVVLRKYTADDELTWDQLDNNFEILRDKLNETVTGLNAVQTDSLSAEILDIKTEHPARDYVKRDVFVKWKNTTTFEQITEVVDALDLSFVRNLSFASNPPFTDIDSSGFIEPDEQWVTFTQQAEAAQASGAITNAQFNQFISNRGLYYTIPIAPGTTLTELVADTYLPESFWRIYQLPDNCRYDAAYTIPVLKVHQYVEQADFNGLASALY